MQKPLLALMMATAACSSSDDPKTFVLVHGAWMGSAGWDTVAADLRAHGDTVLAPELPAHGNDLAPVSDATLAAYVDRVSATLDAADRPVILVGHSMAGLVISQLAEQRPADIAELVYIAAYLPRSGDTLGSLSMTDPDSQIGPHLQFHDDGTVGIDTAAFPDLFCADCDADARGRLVAGYRDEPAMPLGSPVTLSDAFAGVPKTYVHTGADRVVSPALQATMVAATPVDREVTLDTSHVPLLAAPHDLADVLYSVR